MPPKKEKPSKKNQLKKQEKSIEDRTFGLKNKNKSSKVQKFINQVEVGVKNQSGPSKAKDDKLRAKAEKQKQEEEMRILLNEGVSNQFGKKKSAAKEQAKAMGLTESVVTIEFSDSEDEEEEEEVAPQRQNYDDEDDHTHEVTSIEVHHEKTLEDIIEEQRAKLAAEGKTGTPVTAETFAIWRTEKLARKQAELEARVKAEQSKKKGGKGLSILSGKQLFSYNASLFVDDDGAVDTTDDEEYRREQQLREAREEAMQKAAAQKAQEEQEKQLEIQRIEMEQTKAEEIDRRRKARLSTDVFEFSGIRIKAAVFDTEAKEDLKLFADPETPEFDEESEDEAEDDAKKESNGDAEGQVTVNEELFGGDDDDLDDLDDDL